LTLDVVEKILGKKPNLLYVTLRNARRQSDETGGVWKNGGSDRRGREKKKMER